VRPFVSSCLLASMLCGLGCEPAVPPGPDPSSGGSTASGGAASGGSGGTTASGGSSASGGVTGSGGTVGAGGTATGGSTSAGGAPATGGLDGSGGSTGGAAASGGSSGWLSMAETVRIMPLGDSITAEGSCWRHDLWNKLEDAGITNIDFVGTLTASDCGGNYDSDNEGHGGLLVTEVTDVYWEMWFEATNPDVVLLHFATNDVWNSIPTETILAAHQNLVTKLRAVNPNVIVLEAQILPMSASQCAPCQTSIPELNAAMPAWAAEHSTDISPIFVVDQYTGFDPAVDTTDGVHPYPASGADKMASRWFDALVDLY